jgi:hypothetical protein
MGMVKVLGGMELGLGLELVWLVVYLEQSLVLKVSFRLAQGSSRSAVLVELVQVVMELVGQVLELEDQE